MERTPTVVTGVEAWSAASSSSKSATQDGAPVLETARDGTAEAKAKILGSAGGGVRVRRDAQRKIMRLNCSQSQLRTKVNGFPLKYVNVTERRTDSAGRVTGEENAGKFQAADLMSVSLWEY